ncbi:hypothetical protein LT18_00506 [Pseudomonas aeruginosa]|nr:hypothetical protein LT18_00506 [Pseudomonas aeruginosa]
MNERLMTQYTYDRLWDVDLDTAAHSVRLIKEAPSDAFRYPLLRDLIVTYCRPFTKSSEGHRLSEKLVPPESRELHAAMIRLRNGQYAHTDRKLHQPKFSWLNLGEGSRLAMTFKSTDHEGLLARLEDVDTLICALQVKLRERMRKAQWKLEMSGELAAPENYTTTFRHD